MAIRPFNVKEPTKPQTNRGDLVWQPLSNAQ